MQVENSDSETSQLSGSEESSEGDKEFDNDLFKNDIGNAIGKYNESMIKSHSAKDYEDQKLKGKDEVAMEEKQKKVLAAVGNYISPVKDSNDTDAKQELVTILQNNQHDQVQENKIEENKEHPQLDNQDTYFEMIQQQFMNKIQTPRK